mmetsp:Transcript_11390/g.42773  ORF Transcript_11390/g.42773 Transcript_11390/m.42773 type:complete len:417 (-) Transcript_11390:113-1363(-)|eukprot:CAMPEP_0117448516 /NCGR_PEP_ID=MMETSP0759-20121206/7442_1 /TAXON_ID=63605 /ORGANISM="Percolomonas cosmopolitus, Strain WS" /LENGTH=416 /DNA_ID=CAMNT_0005240907 /DNA_START=123 /DNA_END=1373 /DNA_ORIENTATION=+
MPLAKTFDELISALKLKFLIGKPKHLTKLPGHLGWCYELLIEVSRSFALVIQELPESLRDAVCIFYLVLRGLDTVEDDPNMPQEAKLEWLNTFAAKLDQEGGFDVPNCGHRPYYVRLMENFHRVCIEFQRLDKGYRDVIQNITNEMAKGMIMFLEKEGVDTVEEYNEYCHYVAGLVGLGLTDLFVASGLERKSLKESKSTHANSMGLFLQKTNIIRDYYEDIREDRVFWPKDVWSLYADRIEDFKYEQNFGKGVECINQLVTNALAHVTDVFEYMSHLQDRQVFNFCAIPQVMAIATLAEVYNNEDCFHGLVKIRKGMAAKLIYYTKSMDDVKRVFRYFALQIQKKIDVRDPNATETANQVQLILEMTNDVGQMPSGTRIFGGFTFTVGVLGAVLGYYSYRRGVFGNAMQSIRGQV